MIFKLTKPWSGYPSGHVFQGMHDGMGLTLCEMGLAETVTTEKQKDGENDDKQNDTNDADDRDAPKQSGRKRRTGQETP